MKKRVIHPALIVGMTLFIIPFLYAKDPPSSSDVSSVCDTFGIQRFTEKKIAPPFTLKSLEGKTVSLSDFRGKPVLLIFWATWCETCREELPQLEKFSEGKRDQFSILLLVIDGERERKARRIIKENKITLPVGLILKEKIMENYDIRGWVPIIFLIDPGGCIVGKIVGPRDWSVPVAWSAIQEIFSLH